VSRKSWLRLIRNGWLPARSLGPYDVLCDLRRGVGDRDEMCGVSME
jgi:hypothetical protein